MCYNVALVNVSQEQNSAHISNGSACRCNGSWFIFICERATAPSLRRRILCRVCAFGILWFHYTCMRCAKQMQDVRTCDSFKSSRRKTHAKHRRTRTTLTLYITHLRFDARMRNRHSRTHMFCDRDRAHGRESRRVGVFRRGARVRMRMKHAKSTRQEGDKATRRAREYIYICLCSVRQRDRRKTGVRVPAVV